MFPDVATDRAARRGTRNRGKEDQPGESADDCSADNAGAHRVAGSQALNFSVVLFSDHSRIQHIEITRLDESSRGGGRGLRRGDIGVNER